MTIKQLQKVVDVKDDQHVRIHDQRNMRTVESTEGWVLNLDYDYPGHNYEEVERILSLKVSAAEFAYGCLTIWAS